MNKLHADTVSYWNKTAQKERYPRLDRDLEADVLIVGGGITGISCAYCLAQRGRKPVVIEAGGLCDGTTGNTTGKITIQHDFIYGKITNLHGMDFARHYAESQAEALDFVRERVEQDKMNCQYAEDTAYLYASAEADLPPLRKEYEIARELGIDAEYFEKPDFPPGSLGMLAFRHQAVLHPVRYVEALAKAAVEKGARICCDTKAVGVEDGNPILVTCENKIEIRCNHLILATQYPIYDGPNLFFTRLYAKRAYGVAVAATGSWPDGSYIGSAKPTRSIRTHIEDGKRVLIVVGEDHPTARGEDNMELHFERLMEYAGQIGGGGELLAKWSAQDYDTPDQIPYICRVAGGSEIYAAAGFKKWGLSTGTLAGLMLSQMIAGEVCRYERLYSRTRSDYTSALGNALSEVFGSVWELVKSKFEGTEGIRNLKPGEGRVIDFDGQKAGVYRDFEDNVTVLDISCTHMTTELNFNVAEKTWDCPAHGGRFAASDGKLLEGPPENPLRIFYRGKFSDLETTQGE
ncbi:MAG TPA: FAD-dependent oxidoreductase [Oscillospiraceae bacterium]|nr:FAD-dependent oxidoreductase [Oscillospiraceae bacterium]HNW05027.1 FAD-dependent oxidoreductase [Oscillospiraceae bacterium]HPW00020.1 FAD-dependent oxidoreductase [Oscillospiraceae bacterium]